MKRSVINVNKLEFGKLGKCICQPKKMQKSKSYLIASLPVNDNFLLLLLILFDAQLF